MPEDAAVYPTHGFGSFCAATQSGATSFSTIGWERRVNPALTLGEQRYVRELLAGLDAYPAYYAHMGPANAAGPAGPDLTPPHRADAGELRTPTSAAPSTCPCMSIPAAWPRYRTGSCGCIAEPGTAP